MKKIQILVITLIIVLVLGCTTFAVLYFSTDIFKSDKEMFYKYISQVKLENVDIDNYINRLKNEAHSNGGQVSIKLQSGDEIINEGVEFSSQSDPLNNLASAKIDIKQDGKNKLTIDYLRNEELYGLRFEDIVNQYIVVENNNLKEFVQKLGIEDTENVPDKIENNENIDKQEMKQIEQELKQIYSKYINIAIEQIPNENYSKIKKENITVGDKRIEADGYEVTIGNKELKNILVKILDTAKDDEQAFDLINRINKEITFEEYKSAIETVANDLLKLDMQENSINLNIIAYKQGKNLVKVYYKLSINKEEQSGYIDFAIEKIENKLNLKLGFVLDNENILNINLSMDGNLDSKSIGTSATIELDVSDMDASINIEYNSTMKFDSNMEFEEFNSSNYAIINEFSSEQIGNLVVNLSNKIYEKIDEEKSIFGLVTRGLNSGLFEKAQDAQQATQNALEKENELINRIEEQSAEISMPNQAREMFNIKFSAYEGLQNGTNVKNLILAIENNNSNNTENKVEYNQISVDSNKRYNILFEKDENGYINKAIIEEQ